MKGSVFSKFEQKAIEEKKEQLRKVKEGTLLPRELADLITQRRVNWIKKNLGTMLKKYSSLDALEKAYKIICFDHMGIDPEKSKMTRISPRKIRIDSYNFCPYLEACKELGLDTRFVCREIGEPSIREMMRRISPNLKFSRNYQNIRPHNPDFCEEYIELL